MKYNMKYTKVLGLAVAATLAFSACSDEWDEHYKVQQVGDGNSLWEAISGDPSLSNFASVLQATGYDRALASSQVFTVFAPTNDALDTVRRNNLIQAYTDEKNERVKDADNSTIKEFVKNHITLYNHSVSDNSADTLVMLNGKFLNLTADALDGKAFESKNELHTNGILFKVGGTLDYFHNVFEYLDTDEELSGIRDFLYSYNVYKFMPELSVPGGIVNGQTIYLDSVSRLQNELFRNIGLINDEDSAYTMLVPTDSEWNRLVAEYESYFNFNDKVGERDSLLRTLPRLAVVRGTVFSHKENNKHFVEMNYAQADSAVSVNAIPYSSRKYLYGSADAAYYLYDAQTIFNGATPIECSNGRIMKTNTWNIDKTQTFVQNILVEGERRDNQNVDDETSTRTPLESTYITSTHSFYNQISNNSYVEIVPIGPNARPKVSFSIDNVLSNMPYDIQLVLVPTWTGELTDSAVHETVKPNFMNVSLAYLDQVGDTLVEDRLKNYTTNFLREGVDTTYITMDTITVAENYIFPTCSYGLSSPQVWLKIEGRGVAALKKYQGTIRVDAIILKPHEEDSSVEE